MIEYLAAPYGHPDPAVREQRMRIFYQWDAKLSLDGHYLVSPLYKVETAKHGDVPDTWAYWEQYCYELLARCDRMIVLTIDGWDTSKGVTGEIEYCRKHGIPITYIDP